MPLWPHQFEPEQPVEEVLDAQLLALAALVPRPHVHIHTPGREREGRRGENDAPFPEQRILSRAAECTQAHELVVLKVKVSCII